MFLRRSTVTLLVLTHLVAETSQSSAFLSGTIRVIIEIESNTDVSLELENRIANAVWKRSALDASSALGFPEGRLQLRSDGNILHVEVSTKNAGASPPDVYEMVARVQAVLEGSEMKWSVNASSTVDPNVQDYFKIMGDLNDQKKLIARHTSIFSAAEIWNINGATSMFLNGIVMSDSRDEASYHEMLVHPALFAAELPTSVLIIGGGEGATLREALRDTRVSNVTMVDIDEGLVKLCREHLHMMHQGSFSSSKVSLVFEDGYKYLERVKPGAFNVIIVDGIDVTHQYEEDECVSSDTCRSSARSENSTTIASYGDTLFTKDFYALAYSALHSGGTLVQYISDVEDDACEHRLSAAGFNETAIYSVGVDSFYGEGASFVVAAKGFGFIFDRVEQGVRNNTYNLKHLDFSAFNDSFGQERISRRLKRSGGAVVGGGGAVAGGAAVGGGFYYGGGSQPVNSHGQSTSGAKTGTTNLGFLACCVAFCLWLTKPEELNHTGECRIGHAKNEVASMDGPSKVKSVINKKGKEVGLGSAAEAARSIDNDFGSWGPAAGALYFGHLCWLLKEVFWILLIPYAAYTFGLASLLLFLFAICLRFKGGKVAAFYQEAPIELLINVVQVNWQIWNCLMMVADFTWDEPDEVPGYAEDLVNLADCKPGASCNDNFDAVILISRLGLGATFFLWICGLLLLLYKWLTPPNYLMEGYALQTCLVQGGWIAFWVMKDFIWTFEGEDAINVPFAIAAYLIHFGLLILWLIIISSPVILVDGLDDDELDKISANVVTIFDRVSFSYVLWSLSSLMWLLCEDSFDGELSLRFIAAALCALSFLLYLSGFPQVKAKSRVNDIFIAKLRDASVEMPSAPMKEEMASSVGKKASDDRQFGDVCDSVPGENKES